MLLIDVESDGLVMEVLQSSSAIVAVIQHKDILLCLVAIIKQQEGSKGAESHRGSKTK